MPTHHPVPMVGRRSQWFNKDRMLPSPSNLQRGNPLPLDPPYFLERSEFNDKPAGDRVRAADVGWVKFARGIRNRFGSFYFIYVTSNLNGRECRPTNADGGPAQLMVWQRSNVANAN